MDSSVVNVLYLDDEPHNLHAFKAAFRKNYKVFVTDSPGEAEAILEKENIHVIFADQRMPVVSGVQFFEKIRGKHPEPFRILITGYTDIRAAIDAINKGEVFRFLEKPWEETYVRNIIAQAYEIYSTREELKRRNTELRKAYDELDNFVYSASHDLRAPLTSVQGIINLALLEEDPVSQNEYLMLIRQSVTKLDTFIKNIIDYYKNTRGVPVISDVDFPELIEEVFQVVRFMPGAEKIRLKREVKQNVVFRSDLIKLRIILNNFISNAIKFQDHEKQDQFINVLVDVSEEQAVISVEDNGLGIAKDDQEKVFKMFYRATISNSGSGLGLYIVQEAINKLNGKVEIESEPGKGTTFRAIIPSSL